MLMPPPPPLPPPGANGSTISRKYVCGQFAQHSRGRCDSVVGIRERILADVSRRLSVPFFRSLPGSAGTGLLRTLTVLAACMHVNTRRPGVGALAQINSPKSTCPVLEHEKSAGHKSCWSPSSSIVLMQRCPGVFWQSKVLPM